MLKNLTKNFLIFLIIVLTSTLLNIFHVYINLLKVMGAPSERGEDFNVAV